MVNIRIGSLIQLNAPEAGLFTEDFESGWLIWNDFGDPIFIESFNLTDWMIWNDFGSPIFTEGFENGGW